MATTAALKTIFRPSEVGVDPFGRIEREILVPDSGAGTQFVSRTIDYTVPTRQVIREYVGRPAPGSEATAESVRTAIYDDGFGRVWRIVEQSTIVPGAPGTPDQPRYFGTATFFDPSTRRRWQTLPIECGSDEDCAALADLPSSVVTTTTDPLGRVVRIDNPDGGFSLAAYDGSATPSSVPSGVSASEPVDHLVLTDPNQHVTHRLIDGNRVVLVRECVNLDCSNADETLYSYEATGEISTVYDAVAVAATDWTDSVHYLRRHYDTLGRVWKIDDPDGGTSTTAYDAFGNVDWTQNARDQVVDYTFDTLDRLVFVDQPAGPNRNYEITYPPGQRQPDRERVLAQNGSEVYREEFAYDDMGRLHGKTHQFPSTTLLLDFAYDELGRTTEIRYPDDQTLIRYEYDGAYLERVCEVASPMAPDCDAEGAILHVSSVGYDPLGRRETFTTPAGTRTYSFDPTTQRLAEDQFVGTDDPVADPRYERTLTYAEYDGLGNILDLQATTSTGAVDFSAVYTYDRRNRLASWRKAAFEGEPEYFNYDSLGNLIGHAVDTASTAPQDNNQVFNDPIDPRPHAIAQRTDRGITYGYDADGNLSSEEWSSGAERHHTFDALNRLVCVGPVEASCSTLNPDYDSQGRRIREYYTNSSGGWVQRRYAGEYFTLQPDGRGDFHIFAFGEQIAYKRKGPVTLRTASLLPALPWLDPPLGLPLALAALMALGLGGLAVLAIRFEWALGLHDEPALGTLSLALVLVLVLPPLPARAGGGGTTVNYRRWILSDHLGSATVVLDEHGQAKRETVYTPFGEIHDDEGSAETDTSVFAGHPLDEITDLHYMRARWQNPTTGSFLSVDPLIGSAGDPQAYNGYSYVRGNPVSFTDPTGMKGGCFLFFGSGCYSGDGWLAGLWSGWSGGGGGPSIVPIDVGLPIGPGPAIGGISIGSGSPPQPAAVPVSSDAAAPADPGSQGVAGARDSGGPVRYPDAVEYGENSYYRFDTLQEADAALQADIRSFDSSLRRRGEFFGEIDQLSDDTFMFGAIYYFKGSSGNWHLPGQTNRDAFGATVELVHSHPLRAGERLRPSRDDINAVRDVNKISAYRPNVRGALIGGNQTYYYDGRGRRLHP